MKASRARPRIVRKADERAEAEAILRSAVAKRGRGRPSKYSTELTRTLCERIAEGEKMGVAARDLGVDMSTLHRWREDHEDFRIELTRARQLGVEALIAENDRILKAALEYAKRFPKLANAVVSAASNIAHNNRFLASRLSPDYSDRLKVEDAREKPLTEDQRTAIRGEIMESFLGRTADPGSARAEPRTTH